MRKLWFFIRHYDHVFFHFAENLDIIANSDVDLIEREGFHFFNVTGVHVKFTIGGLKLHMGNLFDGHKVLGIYNHSDK